MISTMAGLEGRQLGEYRIIEPIGSGGMGEVYLAEHIHLQKKHALRVLPPKRPATRGMCRSRPAGQNVNCVRRPGVPGTSRNAMESPSRSYTLERLT